MYHERMPVPVSEESLVAAEAALGRPLPRHLRERLLQDNGGEIVADGDDWHLFPVWDPTDRRTVRRTANHIVRENAEAREWESFPQGAVAVASNGTGDLLVVCEGSDEIRLWRHDSGELEAVHAITW
jgi:hypothetical protein